MCRQSILLALAFLGLADSFLQSRSNIVNIHESVTIGRNEHLLFADTKASEEVICEEQRAKPGFDTETALFCAGLAFDAYVEPPANSSRWERGVSD